jgi:hypothetical protein
MYPLPPEIPTENDYFPSEILHTNDKWTIRNWEFLCRGYDEEVIIKEAIRAIRTDGKA